MSKSLTNVFVGFLAGAAAGAVTGVLFAPDKGAKTRKKLKKEARKVKLQTQREMNHKIRDIKENVSEIANDMKDRFSNLESKAKSKMNDFEKNAKSELN